MRTLTIILGAVLGCYCSAGILSETLWPNSETADRALCRLLLCINPPLIERGRQQLMGAGKENAEKAAAIFKSALQRDPQNPYRWAELGDAYLDAGQTENARYCYSRLPVLAPRSAPLLLRVANFHLEIGENREALPLTALILSLTSGYDDLIFSEYARLLDKPDDVLEYGLPEDSRAAKSWLRFLMQAERPDDAQRSWQWVQAHGYADDALAGEYAAFQIRQGHPGAAASAWTQYLGRRAGDYRTATYLFNGDFEAEPVASPFDWSVAGRAGVVEVARDCTGAAPARCSLRIRFAGKQNLDLAVASQLTAVRPGWYRFHALIRTDRLTTDQGLRFRVADAEAPSRLDITFGNFTGDHAWSAVERELLVPPATRLLRVQVIRQASLKFDNKVAGTGWVNALALAAISPPPQPRDRR